MAKPSTVFTNINTPLAYSYGTNVVSGPVAYSSYAHVAGPAAVHVPGPITARLATPTAFHVPGSITTHLATPAVTTYTAPALAPTAVVASAPIVAAPAVVKSQYHAQDELGQASYGHAEPFQQHNAVQDAAGNKVGSYSYVAPNGEIIAANYVADALGYRVASNALPVGPNTLPVAVADTPEVVAARAAHLSAHAEVKSRARRSIVAAHHVPLVGSYYAAAPLYRPATLRTVVNTPAHAVSYHVY